MPRTSIFLLESEFLLNNKLDKDIQRIIQPFNIIFSVFFSSKYKIRNSYITPCDKKYQIILFVINVFFSVWSIYNMVIDKSSNYYMNMFFNSSASFVIYLFSILSFYSIYILLLICNIVYSRTNISLILKIQEIHKSINITKNSVQSFVIGNWISFALLFCISITSITCFYMLFTHIYFLEFVIQILCITFDFNLVHYTCLIILLRKYLEAWILLVINYEEQSCEYCHKLFKIYENIFEAFKLYKTCFRVLVSWCLHKISDHRLTYWKLYFFLLQILCRTIESFIRGLTVVELHLLSLEKEEVSW